MKKKVYSLFTSSEEWSKVGDTERGNLGITVEDDGEFWCGQFSHFFFFLHFTTADAHLASHHAGCPSLTGASSSRTLTCAA